MVTVAYSALTELRPNRSLRVQCILIGAKTMAETSMNLVCVHGTMGSYKQFEGLWQPLSDEVAKRSSGNKTTAAKNGIAVWMLDTMGCGTTPAPKPFKASDCADMEIESDIHAMITSKVDATKPIVFLGHSYGPQTILKLVRDFQIKSVAGFIFCNTGLQGTHENIMNGGPPLFKLPLWFLNCIQPLLTKSFLKMAFSPSCKPEILEASKKASNANSMLACRYYYGAHIWLTGEEANSILSDCATKKRAEEEEVRDEKTKGDHDKKDERIPCMILHGVDDQLVPIESGEAVANILDAKPMIAVDQAGHEILEEQPEFVSQTIADFLFRNGLLLE